MSASGKVTRLGGPWDLYETPSWAVRRLLEAWSPGAGLWVEPGAGRGAIVRAVQQFHPSVEFVAVEVDPALEPDLRALPRTEVVMGDYLTVKLPARAENARVVIGNPPYRKDMGIEFAKQSMLECPYAFVALLLPLPQLASQRRSAWLRVNPPDVYVLPNRPSFRGGGTDKADYGWFIWPPAAFAAGRAFRPRPFGSLHVLPVTPRAEILADEPSRAVLEAPALHAEDCPEGYARQPWDGEECCRPDRGGKALGA